MDEEVAKFDPDEFNPWNVTSVEEFLFYNCPECDMKHTSRDVFINHALLEHPKSRDSFFNMESLPLPTSNEEEKLGIKQEKIEAEEFPEDSEQPYYPEVDPAEYLEQVENEQKPKKIKKQVKMVGHEIEDDEDYKMDLEDQPQNLKCTKCDIATFSTGYELRKHRKFCQPTHFCDICGLKLDSKKELKKHYKLMHKGTENPFAAPKKDSESWPCEQCGRVMANKSSLNKHLKTVHNMYVITPETLVKKCDKCQVEFNSALTMDEHFRTCISKQDTEPPVDFSCKFCNSKWMSHLSLELHIMESHHKVLLICDKCGNCYKGKAELQRHVESHHLGILNHFCHLCGKAFPRKWDLKTHLIVAHDEGERKHKCDKCGKRFLNLHSLKEHIASNHERSTLYQCDQCSSTFWVKNYLQTHIRIVHKKHRPNKCDLCEEAFLYKRDLIKHKEKVHQ